MQVIILFTYSNNKNFSIKKINFYLSIYKKKKLVKIRFDY